VNWKKYWDTIGTTGHAGEKNQLPNEGAGKKRGDRQTGRRQVKDKKKQSKSGITDTGWRRNPGLTVRDECVAVN